MWILEIAKFAIALAVLGSIGWTLVHALLDSYRVAKKMHSIPCSNCQYFNDDHRLKCTVQPTVANTEKAIGCPDYLPKA